MIFPYRYLAYALIVVFIASAGVAVVHTYNTAVKEREQFRQEAQAAKLALADIENGIVQLKAYYADREKRTQAHVNTIKTIMSVRSVRDAQGNIDPVTDPLLHGLNGMFSNRSSATTKGDHP
jgi:hypothetical protein